MNYIHRIVNIFIDYLKIQCYFILGCLRGWIILGIFPSFLASARLLLMTWNHQSDKIAWKNFDTYRQNYQREATLLGYLLILIWGMLRLDINIIKNNNMYELIYIIYFIQSLFIIILSHLPIVFIRYQRTFGQYFSQSLRIGLASLPQIVAILLSYIGLGLLYPYLGWLFWLISIPLILTPWIFFSKQSLQMIESIKKET